MGLRELVLVAMVALILVRAIRSVKEPPGPDDLALDLAPATDGRQPAAATSQAAAPRNHPRSRPFLLRGNRLYWFLTILAATAVAALIITRRDDSRRRAAGTDSLKLRSQGGASGQPNAIATSASR